MPRAEAPLHTCTVERGPLPGTHAVQMHSAHAFGRHWHDSFGFGVIDQGGQVSASGRGPVRAMAGHVITTNPGEVHDGAPLQQQPRSWRMVHVSPTTLAALVGSSGHELTRPVLDDPLLRRAIVRVFQCGASNPDLWEEALAHACGLLVQRHGHRRLDDAPPTHLAPVHDCLLDQMDAPPTLSALAELVGLSRFQLVRQFTRAHGLPPFTWLQQHRLSQARVLVAQGTPLAQAAAACGFADQSHLHRLFVRSFGYTPGAWQRAHRTGPSGQPG